VYKRGVGEPKRSRFFLRQDHEPGLQSVMLLYLYVFVSLLLVGSFLQSLHFEYGMIATQVMFVLLPAIWYWRSFRVDQIVFARLNPLPLKFIPSIVLLAASFWFINMLIAAGLVGGLIELGYEPMVLIEPPSTWQEYLGYLVVLSVFAGICEEILFRGTIMPALEKHGLIPAVVFSSLLFALLHGSFLSLISTFSLGVIMAVIVIKTGSLWGGILYHMLNNFYAATYLFIAGRIDVTPAEVEPQAYLALLPFFVLGLAGVAAGLRQLDRHSDGESLFKNKKNWLPTGWLGWPFYVSLILFMVIAIFEIAVGFSWIDLSVTLSHN
jgi:membrane protease YdiL (CAAX protease family)